MEATLPTLYPQGTRRRWARASPRKKRKENPKSIDRYVKEYAEQERLRFRRRHPKNEKGKAYAIAWSRYCSKRPNSPRCQKEKGTYFPNRPNIAKGIEKSMDEKRKKRQKKAMAERVAADYGRLKSTQKIRVYHSTTFERAVEMVNGFDALEMRKRQFNGPEHRGLFVSPEPATQFGNVVLELEVYAKFLHGTDWSGNIGRDRQDPHSDKYHEGYFDEMKDEYPDSFRPALSESLSRRYEPQALYLGLIKPSQIKRVCHNGEWMSRSDFIGLGEVDGSYAQKNNLRELGFDLSKPDRPLQEVYQFIASSIGGDTNRVKETFTRFVSRGGEQRAKRVIKDTLDRLGFGGLASMRYTEMIVQDLS